MWRLCVGCLLIVTSAILLLARQTDPKLSGLVLIGLDSQAQFDVYYLDLASRQTRNLTNDQAMEFEAAFTADGGYIRYIRTEDLQTFQAVQISIFGQAISTSAEPEGDFREQATSPDGQWRAYTEGGRNNTPISLFRQRSGQETHERIADFPCRDWIGSLAWSPDSQWLAFVHGCMSSSGLYTPHIYRMHVDSDTPTLVHTTPLANTSLHTLQWSPDGEWIAFVRLESDKSQLLRIHPNGEDLQTITDSTVYFDYAPTFSPDGEWLAFIRRDASVRTDTLHRIRADGQALQAITTGLPNYIAASWRPIIDLDWHPALMLSIGMGLLLSTVFFRRRFL